MKEQIDTIPVNDAFDSGDECPFCWLERKAEQSTIRYVAGPGASYMEPDVRAATDSMGFCRQHYKKMYDYGNSLGNALIMQTYYVGMRRELDAQITDFITPEKKKLFGKKPEGELPLLQWLKRKNSTCFLCNKIDYNMNRYYATYFHLIKDEEFRKKAEAGKGFCLHHYAELLRYSRYAGFLAKDYVSMIAGVEKRNLERLKQDLKKFCDKHDYRNALEPLGNAETALPRMREKLYGKKID